MERTVVREPELLAISWLAWVSPLTSWSLSYSTCKMGQRCHPWSSHRTVVRSKYQNVQRMYLNTWYDYCSHAIGLYFMKHSCVKKKRVHTIKNIPDAETISRLHLSANAWYGSGLPEMGFILSFLEYLASNWGRISSWKTSRHIFTYWRGTWSRRKKKNHFTQQENSQQMPQSSLTQWYTLGNPGLNILKLATY